MRHTVTAQSTRSLYSGDMYRAARMRHEHDNKATADDRDTIEWMMSSFSICSSCSRVYSYNGSPLLSIPPLLLEMC